MAETIAFIGLGQMGGPIAGHLAKAGYNLTVCDRVPTVLEAWTSVNRARVAPTPKEAAVGAIMAGTSVVTEADLRAATTGPEGTFQSLKPGSVHVDHSTMSASICEELSREAEKRGIDFLDAPVAGAVEGAKKGILSVMVGGDPKALEKVTPLMKAYSRSIRHVGQSGHGQLAKLTNQIIISAVIQGMTEGLTFAFRAGLDMRKAVDVLMQGTARSWWLEVRAEQMISNLEAGRSINHGRAGLLIKDLAIALAESRRHDFGLPISGLISQTPVEIS